MAVLLLLLLHAPPAPAAEAGIPGGAPSVTCLFSSHLLSPHINTENEMMTLRLFCDAAAEMWDQKGPRDPPRAERIPQASRLPTQLESD